MLSEESGVKRPFEEEAARLQGAAFEPLQPDAEIEKTRRNLPHWTQFGVTHYITFRLGDSLPAARVRQWVEERDAWVAHHPEPWTTAVRAEYAHIFHRRIDKWLDAGSGECILARPRVADLVEGAIHFFDGQRYFLDAYVIMPNHVHLLVAIVKPDTPTTILHSRKSYTAHEANKRLNRKGTVWQDESFDHIVRSVDQLEYFRTYIRENPTKARIHKGFRVGHGRGVDAYSEEGA